MRLESAIHNILAEGFKKQQQPLQEAFPTTLKSPAAKKVFEKVQELDADDLEEFLFGLAGYMHKVGNDSDDAAFKKTGEFIGKAAFVWKARQGN